MDGGFALGVKRILGVQRIQVLSALALVLAAGAARAEPMVVDLPIRDGALPEDRRVIRVQEGDEVTLRWSSDQPLTVHLHGYDLEQPLSPSRVEEMHFVAEATGRFPVEVHGSGEHAHQVLGYLEVHPR